MKDAVLSVESSFVSIRDIWCKNHEFIKGIFDELAELQQHPERLQDYRSTLLEIMENVKNYDFFVYNNLNPLIKGYCYKINGFVLDAFGGMARICYSLDYSYGLIRSDYTINLHKEWTNQLFDKLSMALSYSEDVKATIEECNPLNDLKRQYKRRRKEVKKPLEMPNELLNKKGIAK